MAVKGVSVAVLGAGGILVWSGLFNKKITQTIQDLVRGQKPQPGPLGGGAPNTSGASTSPGAPDGKSDRQAQTLGKAMAASYGWTGQEWTDLNSLIMGESGWSSTIVNPDSGAAGIAQNINGFGPGYQKGNAAQQIRWLLKYIKQRYGSPSKAYAFWLAQDPHWY